MQLPKCMIPYFVAKIWATKNSTTTHLSRYVNKSHDFLTRKMKKKFSWKAILFQFTKGLDLSTGYLVFDETESDKSYANKIFGLSWIFSHLKNKFIFGYQFVVLVWTDGKTTIPLGWKIYRKKGKDARKHKTKIDLAMELLECCLINICSNPRGILFDSFYSAEKMLKLIERYGLKYYGQVEKSRTLNFKQLRKHNRGRPRWSKVGKLKGSLVAKIIKHDRKYFITNDLQQSGIKIRRIYSIRWRIEEVFRFCKDQLDFEGCQMQDMRSQNNHVGTCFFLYCVLQDTAEKTQMTEYKVKEELSFDRSFRHFPNLEALFNYA